ncbi:putative methyltransferase mitochondrial-like protein [Nannochloropsis gaditana]|uniref:Putative methyltransferase mitochondrial-like protein n=1 Tax=Nannochloropsis gaditana TaxID=72520 RepID=W7TJD0_9STRA|nr:putative methyltransferase mitochondrial-like protein [Nannochloropsis gaditana]
MTMLPGSAVATAKSVYMSAARGRISTQFPIVASPLSSMPSLTIFDRVGKKRQRSRAATKPDWAEYEYLRAEVAKRLVDRLEDIMRDFPQALELGAYGPHIAQEVNAVKGLNGKGGAGGIETLVRCGLTEEGLLPASMTSKSVTQEGDAKILNLVGDEEHLPFSPASFDLIVSNLSLHWINDLPGAMNQAREVLKPDGVFLASMFGGNTLKELRVAFQLAEQEREGGISPHVSPSAHVADCGSLLQAAGFALPTVDVDTITVSYPDALVLMEHLQGMGESSAILTRRPYVSRETFLAAAAIYQVGRGATASTDVIILSKTLSIRPPPPPRTSTRRRTAPCPRPSRWSI